MWITKVDFTIIGFIAIICWTGTATAGPTYEMVVTVAIKDPSGKPKDAYLPQTFTLEDKNGEDVGPMKFPQANSAVFQTMKVVWKEKDFKGKLEDYTFKLLTDYVPGGKIVLVDVTSLNEPASRRLKTDKPNYMTVTNCDSKVIHLPKEETQQEKDEFFDAETGFGKLVTQDGEVFYDPDPE